MRVTLFLILLFSSVLADSGNLIVKISNINSSLGGNLIIALFNSDKGWPKIENSWQKKVITPSDSTMHVTFVNLEISNEYAVEIFHDSNSNSKIDINLNPFNGSMGPREGTGLSNNYRPTFSPKFKGAKFLYISEKDTSNIMIIYP